MSGPKSKSEADEAAMAAAKGAGWGVLKFTAPLVLLHPVALRLSPLYRGLTPQFKVFLLLSGATLGGWLEADSSLREYERRQRIRKVRARDDAVWGKWENMLEEEEMAKIRARREGVGKET